MASDHTMIPNSSNAVENSLLLSFDVIRDVIRWCCTASSLSVGLVL